MNTDSPNLPETDVYPETQYFVELSGWADSVRAGNSETETLFQMSLRAAFAKCYDFNVAIRETVNDPKLAYCVPSLRGICEDLIIFGYLKTVESDSKDQLFSDLMAHGVAKRTQIQAKFFSCVRPGQQVLAPTQSQPEILEIENRIRSTWRSNGWPNLPDRHLSPPTRQIAEKQGSKVLLCLYDYLFRLTSGTVHFDVPSLLRTGWGDAPAYKFSVNNFLLYYAAFCRAYGAFLFLSFLEQFPGLLATNHEETNSVNEIRDWLNGVPRWPEMVTFEEMNQPVPKLDPFMQSAIRIVHREMGKTHIGPADQ